MLNLKRILIFLTLIFLIVPIVFAHTPLKPSGENNSLETAFDIPNPTKSWTLYRELHEEYEAEYFKLHLHEGEKFVVSIYTPRNADPNFVPNLIVIGPSIENQSQVPDNFELLEGAEASFIEGSRPEAPDYEPFTPASYFFTSDYRADVTIEGDYYFVVYSDKGKGRYGVAVGYIETFTLTEWLMIPFDVIGIHQWEGQSLTFILTPIILTLILGLSIIFWRFKPKFSVATLLGVIAGLLYIGSGFMTITQMLIALIGATSTSSLILTIFFSILPIVLGIIIIRKTLNYTISWTTRDRLIFAIFGIIGFFLWAGLLVGPFAVLIVSMLPAELFT